MPPAQVPRQYSRYTRLQKYLILTDVISSFLWIAVLLRFLILFPLVGTRFLPGGIADFFLSVQCIIFIDLFNYYLIYRNYPNSQFLKRVNLNRILLTIFSRVLVSFGVLYAFPKTARHISFSTLIIANSLQESTRYIYNAYKIRTYGKKIYWLQFAKKLLFIIFFPIEIISEVSLIFISLQFADAENKLYGYLLRAILFFYVPFFYVLYKTKIVSYFVNPLVATFTSSSASTSSPTASTSSDTKKSK
ncbi:hypothetical protein BVG19_g3133 [[Candida] boidinii]|nr:hypothetical protein BVG19_g3133 [[Candida] boidinii]OWB50931.1 hypothetical protein B5S27_g2485 [[Candida] boidinii]